MKKYLLIITCIFSSLTGCAPYKVPVEQGNIIKPEMIDQLETGMSKSQVEYIMGSPIIKDTFNGNRWDYVYTLKMNKQERQQKRLTLFFKGDHLKSFSGNALNKPDTGDVKLEAAKSSSDDAQNEDLEKRAEQVDAITE